MITAHARNHLPDRTMAAQTSKTCLASRVLTWPARGFDSGCSDSYADAAYVRSVTACRRDIRLPPHPRRVTRPGGPGRLRSCAARTRCPHREATTSTCSSSGARRPCRHFDGRLRPQPGPVVHEVIVIPPDMPRPARAEVPAIEHGPSFMLATYLTATLRRGMIGHRVHLRGW
jgi:hypothetical protein